MAVNVDLESLIRAQLLNLAAVSALTLGSASRQRIYPMHVAQRANQDEETIIIEVQDEDRTICLDGLGGLVIADVDLVCRSSDIMRSKRLAEAVRTNDTDPGTGLAGADFTVTVDSVTKKVGMTLQSATRKTTYKKVGSDEVWYDIILGFLVEVEESV